MGRPVRCLFLLLCVLQGFLNAQDGFKVISGVLSENLTAETPVLVVGDVFISPGSTITIEAGAVLLFESFTGLHVQGTLYVKGTVEKPVVFTSKNDHQYNTGSVVDPAPFDWNGIDVYDGAIGTVFQNCSIKYSVYGIRSQTEHFKIINTLFSSNGKADVTINGEALEPVANEPFSYGLTASPLPTPEQLSSSQLTLSDSVNTISLDTVPGEALKSKHKTSPAVKLFRYSGLIIGLGCAVVSGWYYKSNFEPAQKKLEDLSELDEREMVIYSSKDWEAAKAERDRTLGLCIGGAGGVVIGLGIFSLSFAF